MDPHVPSGPVHSLKDFLIHLGIVTLGILIALGLEQLVEMHRLKSMREEAVAGFRHELTDDRQLVRDSLQLIAHQHEQIQAAIVQLSSPTGGADEISYPGVVYNFVANASWDTAVATRALNEMPYEEVRRYAAAYAALRLFADQQRTTFDQWQSLRRFGEQRSGMSAQQRSTLMEDLRRYDSASATVGKIGDTTLKYCDAALQ